MKPVPGRALAYPFRDWGEENNQMVLNRNGASIDSFPQSISVLGRIVDDKGRHRQLSIIKVPS
jgi:hypothetical protein